MGLSLISQPLVHDLVLKPMVLGSPESRPGTRDREQPDLVFLAKDETHEGPILARTPTTNAIF